MNAKTVSAMLFSVLVLVGCISPEERERRLQARAEQEEAQRQAYRQGIQNRCASYGFRPGTPDFSNCVMQIDQGNRQMLMQQMLQDESARQQRAMPYCADLPPGQAGYMRAQGRCR
jgi:hypothetical protein